MRTLQSGHVPTEVPLIVEPPAIVPLALTRALAQPSPTARVHWQLRYQQIRAADASVAAPGDRPVARLRLGGARASCLRRIAVSHGERTVFELDSWMDPVGRGTAAGEVLAAMAHYRGRPGLVIELHSDGVLVPIGSAAVDLVVESEARAVVPDVGVSAELW